MKKYSEVIKQAKVYLYMYCDKCDQVFIDDLFYIAAPKRCPICGRVPLMYKADHIMVEKEIRIEMKKYLAEEKKKKEEMEKAKESEEFKKKILIQ